MAVRAALQRPWQQEHLTLSTPSGTYYLCDFSFAARSVDFKTFDLGIQAR